MTKLSTFLVTSLISFNSFSSELLPLTKYIETADPNDLFTQETIAKRCSGMNLAMTRWAKNGDELFKVSTENYTTWFLIAIEARALKFPDDDPDLFSKNIASSIVNIMEEVDKLMKRNQDLTGSIFSGTFLETDFQLCSMMRNQIMEVE